MQFLFCPAEVSVKLLNSCASVYVWTKTYFYFFITQKFKILIFYMQSVSRAGRWTSEQIHDQQNLLVVSV